MEEVAEELTPDTPEEAPAEAPAAAEEAHEAREEAPAPAVDVEALVAEAEQRGYRRAMNERIEALMARPGTWEQTTPTAAAPAAAAVDTTPVILAHTRRSIWDD